MHTKRHIKTWTNKWIRTKIHLTYRLLRSPIADGTNDLRYVLDLESFQEVYPLPDGRSVVSDVGQNGPLRGSGLKHTPTVIGVEHEQKW